MSMREEPTESAKKARQPFLYAVSSGLSAVLDIGVYYVLMLLLESRLGNLAEAVCLVLARAVSSFFNFNLNNRMVFHGRGDYGRMLLRYYILAVPVMLVSAGLVALLHFKNGGSTIAVEYYSTVEGKFYKTDNVFEINNVAVIE